jgi:2-polyprenyl-6-methoxyphenol hydroxylase-like FAD-dependent oxidoreductase
MPQSLAPSGRIEAQVEADVAIVGAGPVGLTLALDLAWRGVDVAVAECRYAHEPPSVKCGQISARSMEIFRRLGLSDTLRELGLPADFSNDIVSRTTATGIELARVPLPSRGARRRPDAVGADTWWPTPEHTHRVNQIFFEPILSAHAAAHPRIRLLNRTMVEDFAQTADGVTATARDLDNDTRTEISARFLVGCDGARSMVRKALARRSTARP